MNDYHTTPPQDERETPLPHTNMPAGSTGPIFGIVIILAVLILGGWYYWTTQFSPQPVELPAQDRPQEETNTAAQIEAELEDTVDIPALEAEIDAALEDIDRAF